jgi:hypothetical protein
MVVVLVFGIVSIGLFKVLHSSGDSYQRQKATLEMQQNARVAIEALGDDFRSVSAGRDPSQPSIEFSTADSVVFVADVLADVPGAEVISYALSSAGDPYTPNPNDTILMKTVRTSLGVLLYEEPQSYGIKVGGLSLRYFNGDGVELSNNPLAEPELVGEVLIDVTAVEPQANKATGTYLEETLSATVYPRNLPLAAGRRRPSEPVILSTTIPNCESVTLTWTTPTTYTDDTALEFTDISHFTVHFGTSPEDMWPFSRVVRTINQFTVTGLTTGVHYTFGVSCTTTSQVASYIGTTEASVGSTENPEGITGLTWQANPYGAGIRLDWDQVTQFTDGAAITTPVDYLVYRDTESGFVPDGTTLLETVAAQTWYVDSTLVDCESYYFVVSAKVCGNEGSCSSEISASEPAAPECVWAVGGSLTDFSGEILAYWTHPQHRMGGSSLDAGDITGSRIYYSTEPYTYTQFIDIAGADTTYTLSGLDVCTTYFINVATFDQCPHLGDLCMMNELQINTGEPCDPEDPQHVPFLHARGLSQRIDLTWPHNEADCDLFGYRVYYGDIPGGPYHGTGAVQGPSPIAFAAADVEDIDSCRVSLTGLAACTYYSLAVTVIDRCDPPNESPLSLDATLETECVTCNVDVGCVGYLCGGMGYGDVHLELYPTTGLEEVLEVLTPAWGGPQLVSQVWAGRPLIPIWSSDGSAGQDGAIGPPPPGVELNIDDYTLPPWAVEHDGIPFKLVFDGELSGQTLEFEYRADGGGSCYSEGRQVREGFGFDNFDDGGAGDWTVVSGTWSVVDGELYQSVTDPSTCRAMYPGSFTDFVYEAKVKCVSGQTPAVVFRAIDDGNLYMFGLKLDQNIARLCKYHNWGAFVVTAQATVPLSHNEWYQLRVEMLGNTITAYLNCERILQVTDFDMHPSGGIGLRTYQSTTYYDDVRIYAAWGS